MESAANHVWFLKELATLALDEYDQYIVRMLSAIDREWNAFIQEVEERAKLLGEEATAKYYDYEADLALSLTRRFPAMLSHSTFVSLYGFFEKFLFDVCDLVQRLKKLDDGHVSVSGKGIERAKRYLKRKCNLPVPTNSMEWQEITQYNALRNVLSHRMGKIKNYDADDDANDTAETKKIKRLAQQVTGIEIEWDGQVLLKPEVCRRVAGTMRRFLVLLLDGFPEAELAPASAKS